MLTIEMQLELHRQRCLAATTVVNTEHLEQIFLMAGHIHAHGLSLPVNGQWVIAAQTANQPPAIVLIMVDGDEFNHALDNLAAHGLWLAVP